MHAVGDECGGADVLTDAYPIDGDNLVACEADETGRQHPAEVLQGLGLEHAEDGFDGGHHCRERHHRDDEQSGQILDPPEAVVVRAGGCAAAQRECHPQRHSGQGVREVVDRIRQQRHRTTEQENSQLQHGGDRQDGQGYLQGADAFGGGLHRLIDGLSGIMAVRNKQAAEEALQPGGVGVPVPVVVGIRRAVFLSVPMSAVMGMTVHFRAVAMGVVGRLIHASAPVSALGW
jgi:hypothetical protein